MFATGWVSYSRLAYIFLLHAAIQSLALKALALRDNGETMVYEKKGMFVSEVLAVMLCDW